MTAFDPTPGRPVPLARVAWAALWADGPWAGRRPAVAKPVLRLAADTVPLPAAPATRRQALLRAPFAALLARVPWAGRSVAAAPVPNREAS